MRLRGGSRAAAGLMAVGLLAACTDGSPKQPAADEDEAAAIEAKAYEAGDESGFYEAPDPLPEGEPGTLLRYQPLEDYDVADADAWRVMYLSESLEGESIVVTGTVLIPPDEAPAEGRRLLTISHGTTGVADQCAPSHNPAATELSLSGPFIEAGYVVAMTDYEGLGTPGRHPYLVGESEGRSTLDAAKAAAQIPKAELGEQYAIIGYSQGGHGALWANQLADEWGPDMELVGTVAGAPATELPTIYSLAKSVTGFSFSMIAGFADAYPEADPGLILTDAGLDALDVVDEGCIGDVFGALGELGDEELFQEDYGETEPWVTLMKDNNPGEVAVEHPVLILHSEADNVVPAQLSGILFDRMCGLGQDVERRLYDEGKDHIGAAPDAYIDGFDWIQSRMSGTPSSPNCP